MRPCCQFRAAPTPHPPKNPAHLQIKGGRGGGGLKHFSLMRRELRGNYNFCLGAGRYWVHFRLWLCLLCLLCSRKYFLNFNVLYYLGLVAACRATLYFLPILNVSLWNYDNGAYLLSSSTSLQKFIHSSWAYWFIGFNFIHCYQHPEHGAGFLLSSSSIVYWLKYF